VINGSDTCTCANYSGGGGGTQVCCPAERSPAVAVSAPVRPWCASEKELRQIGRAVFVEVDLDSVANNFRLLKAMCRNKNVGVVGVVKGNAYGHGAVPVVRHLASTVAVDRLAVANIPEAIHLRRAGTNGIIHILGNVQSWEMSQCVRYRLVPTVASVAAIRGMAAALAAHRDLPSSAMSSPSYCSAADDECQSARSGHETDKHCEHTDRETVSGDSRRRRHCCAPVGTIHIKVDTGMSRNGCQPDELSTLVEACKVLGVPLEGIFSHISNHEDPNYSRYQLDNYLECIKPYRNDGYIFHIANSGAVLYDIGTDLDLIRPGISAFGMPSGFLSQIITVDNNE
jgi:alanine racemase